nr:flagellar type III secretion system pore protein FliP [Nocardioides kongjuensis]
MSLALTRVALVVADPGGPKGPNGPGGGNGGGSVQIDLSGMTDKPSNSLLVFLALTLLSLLPAIVLTCTSFTKVLVVLGLTRNALGLQQTPNNQVLAGLALFLSLFIMSPVLSQVNDDGVQPYLDGDKTTSAAFHDGMEPLRDFMLDNTDDGELQLLTSVADRKLPENRDDVSTATLIPAFVLSELKDAFVIGFIIFIPFLVIDIVVSGALMSLGMMMMPPVMVSLPFKLLLFVMVDGWALVIKALVASYGTG